MDVKDFKKMIVEMEKKMVKKSKLKSNFVEEEYNMDV